MSLLNNLQHHATNRYPRCGCGGTILSGPDHFYCDRCTNVVYFGDEIGLDEDEAMAEIIGADADSVDNTDD